MGKVYRAENLETRTTVALKVIDLEQWEDPRAAKRFAREARVGNELKSPYIARTLDSGMTADMSVGWLALECIDGKLLSEFLRENRSLESTKRHELLRELFSAISTAHAGNVVHRDLKPDNVMVTHDGHLKVLDFGIAKALAGLSMSGTAPGLGTPLWTAPEQATPGYQPLPNSDVWALGLLSFYLLTSRKYWKHAQEPQQLASLIIEVTNGPIELPSARLREIGSDAQLPEGFDDWFSCSVARDPARRFANASEAWAALSAILRGKPQRDLLPRSARDSASNRERAQPTAPGPLMATLVIVAVLGLAISLIVLLCQTR